MHFPEGKCEFDRRIDSHGLWVFDVVSICFQFQIIYFSFGSLLLVVRSRLKRSLAFILYRQYSHREHLAEYVPMIIGRDNDRVSSSSPCSSLLFSSPSVSRSQRPRASPKSCLWRWLRVAEDREILKAMRGWLLGATGYILKIGALVSFLLLFLLLPSSPYSFMIFILILFSLPFFSSLTRKPRNKAQASTTLFTNSRYFHDHSPQAFHFDFSVCPSFQPLTAWRHLAKVLKNLLERHCRRLF